MGNLPMTMNWMHTFVIKKLLIGGNKGNHDNQNLDYRIQELIETHGTDAVYEVIDSAVGVDLKDHAAAMNKALDEAFDDKS